MDRQEAVAHKITRYLWLIAAVHHHQLHDRPVLDTAKERIPCAHLGPGRMCKHDTIELMRKISSIPFARKVAAPETRPYIPG